MKSIKKVTGFILFVMIVVCGFITLNSQEVHAAVSVPKTVNCGVGVAGCRFINITHEEGNRIKNLKSNNSNMRVKADPPSWESSYINIYCKKAGTYKMSFDLYTKNNKKKKSYSITVYAAKCWWSTNGNIKSVQLDGKDIEGDLVLQPGTDARLYYTTKTSAKVKVTVSKNVTLKKIQISTYNKNGTFVDKTIKNGSKAVFSTVGMQAEDSYDGSISQQKTLFAESVITVTVQEKGSPYPEMISIYVNVPARTWAKMQS